MPHAMRRVAGPVAFITASVVALSLSTAPVHAADTAPSIHPDFVMDFFPVETAVVHFTDSWGARRSGGRRHRGTDVHAPKATPIVAVAPGVVDRMGWNDLSGWYLAIRHADGWESVYIHLNNDNPGTDDGAGGPQRSFTPGLVVGSAVAAGEVIAFVGDSGNAENTVPHVHFELHHDGQKVDPYDYLEAAWLRQLRCYELDGTVS